MLKLKAVGSIYFLFLFDLFSIFLFLKLKVRVKVTRSCYYTLVISKNTVIVMVTSHKTHRRMEKILKK